MANNETTLKTCEYYDYLPQEFRKFFVKNSVEEAKIYGLEVLSLLGRTTITFFFEENEKRTEGFELVYYEEDDGEQCVKYQSLKKEEEEEVKIVLDKSTDLLELSIEHFRNPLQQYQNDIKQLSLHCWRFECDPDVDYGIQSLDKLEKLEICDCHDVRYFVSKLKQPLKELTVQNLTNKINLEDFGEEIYKVQNTLLLERVPINNEEFLRLTAPKITTFIEDLTEKTIYDFLNSWQNGRIRKHVSLYEWYLMDSEFNVSRLCRLLRVSFSDVQGIEGIELKHLKQDTKIGVLKYDRRGKVLKFEVRVNRE